tara:strand:+ start:11137 stop:12720 length:1584 start_codon:yes stop_codon:yes gene_type:complete
MHNYNRKIVPFFIFILILYIGVNIYKDFGISVDEIGYRHQGVTIIYTITNFIFPNFVTEVANSKNWVDIKTLQETQVFSGITFHVLSAGFEYILNFNTKEDVFSFKHLLTFLVFYIGVFFLFLTIKILIIDYKYALIGVIFLILSPRIFAESFYNPNDIPFMTSVIITTYINLKFLKKLNNKYLYLSILFSAIAISLRPMAIYIPFLVIIFLIYLKKVNSISNIFLIKIISKKIFLIIILSFLLNPPLWIDPLSFILQFRKAINFNIAEILYLGQFYQNSQTPWHYLFVWLILTTPILYIVLFVFGLVNILSKLNKFLFSSNSNFNHNEIFILFNFLIPFLAAVLLSKSLLNGWRHLYFVYPFFLIISVIGLNWIFSKLIKSKITKIFFKFLILCFLINISYWMYNHHPFQMVYYNLIAGKNLQDKFEHDYWGLSNKTAIKNILKKDTNDIIKIYGISGTRLDYTVNFYLDPELQKRLKIVKNIDEADYIISIYNGKMRRNDILNKGYKIFDEIIVDRIVINSTFVK